MTPSADHRSPFLPYLIYLVWAWAVAGFTSILVLAMQRMAPYAIEALSSSLSDVHLSVLIGNILAMAYYEGYKGFQCSFSPRFAARAQSLMSELSWPRVLLAPLFCMGFFAAPRRRIASAIILSVAIIVLVLIFRELPQPWRGILDAGVVVGLAWGCVATIYFSIDALVRGHGRVPAEISN
ncbi:MAG: hypothetical protein O3C28_11820 [Proteobacteria bacterium]|nr:hypothetical protein [Pseudomonadota bacterium]